MAFDPRALLAQVPQAAPVGPTVPDDVKAFVARLGSGAPAPTLPTASEIEGAQIDTALADDARRQGAATLAANLDRYAQIYRGEPAGQMKMPALDEQMKAYVLKRQGEQQAADRDYKRGEFGRSVALAGIKARMDADEWARRFGLQTDQREQEREQERQFREGSREDEQAFRAQQAAEARALQAYLAKLARDAAAGARDERKTAKDDEKRRRLYLGEDFENTADDREIAPPVLAAGQKQMVDARRVLTNIGRVQDLLQKNPNGALVGDDAVRLAALVEAIKLREKEIQGLGVLNGQDYEILSRMVADPTSLREGLKSGSGIRPLKTAFEALRALTLSDANEMASSLGFKAKPGSPFSSEPAPRKRVKVDADGNIIGG